MADAAVTPEVAMAANPHATLLTVQDGRRSIGRLVDTAALLHGARGPVLAFDLHDRLVGTFNDRRTAAAALPGRSA